MNGGMYLRGRRYSGQLAAISAIHTEVTVIRRRWRVSTVDTIRIQMSRDNVENQSTYSAGSMKV